MAEKSLYGKNEHRPKKGFVKRTQALRSFFCKFSTSSGTVGFRCFSSALSKPVVAAWLIFGVLLKAWKSQKGSMRRKPQISATAKVKSKCTLRERLQETPEPHSKYPIISPELIEKLHFFGLSGAGIKYGIKKRNNRIDGVG